MSAIRKLETVAHQIMEPHLSGDSLTYHEAEIESPAYQCLAPNCGLVWAKKWHAETCEQHGHRPTWQQMYCQGVENGQPIKPVYYPRYALRRDPLPEKE